MYVFFFKQKTAYEMRISDWSSDVCSSDLDELWEAMKPSFKPRLVSDPNIKYAKHLVNQTGPFATRGALTSLGRTDVRATLARVVRRAPEVLVKVTGRKKGAKH